MQHDKPKLVVWGAGGHGKVVVDALLARNDCDVIGILDDDPAKLGKSVLGVPILFRHLDELSKLPCDGVALAIGDNYTRHAKLCELRNRALKPANVLHPSAHVSPFAKLGEGVTILAGATVNPGTVIEDGACVNTSASVDHDNRLGLCCHIFPNATLAGGVQVGEFTYIGSGAVVLPNLVVHEFAYVGAGAVVIGPVPQGIIVGGVPAIQIGRQLRRPSKPERKVSLAHD